MNASAQTPQFGDTNTRQRIETAVLAVFSQHDYYHASLQMVAKEAKVSLRTIYKYYGNKEQLFLICIGSHLEQLSARVLDHLQAVTALKDRVHKIFWLTLDYFETYSDMAKIIFGGVQLNLWRDDHSFTQPEVMSVLMSALKQGRKEGIINSQVSEMMILDYMLGVISRLVTMWLVRGRNYSLTEQHEVLFEMLWRAIANPAVLEQPTA